MNASHREKSLWAVFVGLLVSFGAYFWLVLPAQSTSLQPEHVMLFVAAVVLLVVTQVIGQVLAVAGERHIRTDERDRLIELKGTRNGAYALAAGVFAALCTAVLTEGNFLFVHVLLAAWVVAQLIETGSQLFFYRREI